LSDLLSTHPPLNRRILLLYQMAGLRPGMQKAEVSPLQSISAAAS
jgi:hypothetical protein